MSAKGASYPRNSFPCPTAEKCEMICMMTVLCKSWKFNEKNKRCRFTTNRDSSSDIAMPCTMDVVLNRCTPEGPLPIPESVTAACKSIGYGLIELYTCTHVREDFNAKKQSGTCCRDVVLNLCNGSPGDLELPGGQIINIREQCIRDGYNDCFDNKCSTSCVRKVLFEMCGPVSNTACYKLAEGIADENNKQIGFCKGSSACENATKKLCEEFPITKPEDIDVCFNLGKFLCDRN